MERLLRQTGVPAGLLFNGRALRLISAPRGESSGWTDFSVADMVQVAGRPISTALRLLLNEKRLLSMARPQRLAALLDDSRKFQNEVSERLSEQVLHALYELLRGFQAAHNSSKGELLREPLAEHPDEVYRALLTVVLRLVFVLFAEERDMFSKDGTFERYYSLAGLFDRLREDAALFPDTMDQRYGAWAQLLTLFRMIHDGADSGAMRLPKRHGVLFDPDRFKFLEGRTAAGVRQLHERIEPPLVPDGTIYRALEKLLVLDGERISYRALDVEQIGSVYETMMGFRLETATGRSVAIKAQKSHGAPTAVDIEALLREPANKREKWLQDCADRKISDKVAKATVGAATLEDLHAALLPVIDTAATPDLVPKGAMVLQPSEERRRSGSHYTPRALTEPIVRTTLEPILARLRGADGLPPRSAQILDLKVCDPAMGSGAFLVEACRQLGDALVEAWHAHAEVPAIPPDEDELILARRLVAQCCLYGVDRNSMAVDLAKVSLWLVTLAKDHALTFVDHALRHGDSLVGLSREQIEAFHWDTTVKWESPFRALMRDQLRMVAELRQRIREADEGVSDWERRDLWDKAQCELGKVRLFGDLVLAAYFQGENPRDRERMRSEYVSAVVSGEADRYRGWLDERRHADPPLVPFHWEIEFPEVFDRERPGFDGIVGNPPYLGGHRLWSVLGGACRDYLKLQDQESGGKAVDLVAHFFRRCFALTRDAGSLGLLATNTIAQGDTREAGLGYLCKHGATIYSARRRVPWPGLAVVGSVVHLRKGLHNPKILDGREVAGINSYLFASPTEFAPQALVSNRGLSFRGSMVYGMGFTFDDKSDKATSLAQMQALIDKDPRNQERIFRFIGGEDLNSDPLLSSSRFIINFEDMSLTDAEKWPDLLAIVREKVKPDRDGLGGYGVADRRREYWWQYGSHAAALQDALSRIPRCLALSQVSPHLALAFQPTDRVFSHSAIVFPVASFASFCVLQSRLHELWARFFSGTAMELLRYTPSDSLETFPFPDKWEQLPSLEAAGRAYYEFRSVLMVRCDEGLTQIYNRFHNPNARDSEITTLRALHSAMDRALLDIYGWRDIVTECEFLLDYEIDESEWGDKKKPYRYRWPDDVRDEVLARLLELNANRAAKETLVGGAKATKNRKPPRKRSSKDPNAGDLFS
jgi:hypothetical protein